MGLVMLPESEVWLARRHARLLKEAQDKADALLSDHTHHNGNSGNGSYQSLDNDKSSNGADEMTKNREAGDEHGLGPTAIDIDLLNKQGKHTSKSPIDGERQSLISSQQSSSDDDDTNDSQENCCVRRLVFLPKPIRNSYATIQSIHNRPFHFTPKVI